MALHEELRVTHLGDVPSVIAQALDEGEDLRFTFEAAANGDTPYWQQGNPDFETQEALAMRAALRQELSDCQMRPQQVAGEFIID